MADLFHEKSDENHCLIRTFLSLSCNYGRPKKIARVNIYGRAMTEMQLLS